MAARAGRAVNLLFPPAMIEQARSVDLVALVARRVKLTRKGKAFWGCCPFHAEQTPSFKVENERAAYHCFGCGAGGDAIAWLEKTEGLSFIDAVRALTSGAATSVSPLGVVTRSESGRNEKTASRRRALEIWDAAAPAQGTAVADYLAARGIVPPPAYWSELRYAPRLLHAPSKRYFGAMVARISDERGFCAIQRTYLDGVQKADVMPAKMTKGPMEGGAVRLRAPDETLGIAEGIETALSARQIYSMPVWAALACVRLAHVEIPPCVKFLCIFGDPDKAGRAEAFAAADVHERAGLRVEVLFPESDFAVAGKDDFNTILKQGAARKHD
jgi:DNA primase